MCSDTKLGIYYLNALKANFLQFGLRPNVQSMTFFSSYDESPSISNWVWNQDELCCQALWHTPVISVAWEGASGRRIASSKAASETQQDPVTQ